MLLLFLLLYFWTKINKYQIYISKKLIGKQTRPTFRKPEKERSQRKNEQKIFENQREETTLKEIFDSKSRYSYSFNVIF